MKSAEGTRIIVRSPVAKSLVCATDGAKLRTYFH